MRCVSGAWRSPYQRPSESANAPATLKYLRLTAPMPFIRAYSASAVSTASFEAPYGLVGLVGAVSVMGTLSGSP